MKQPRNNKLRFSIIILICLFSHYINGQAIFYQNTFRGGACGDGQVIFGDISHPFLRADTIRFQNQVPSTASIKKAFLLTSKHDYYSDGLNQEKELPLRVKLNNDELKLDSSDNFTQSYFLDPFNRPFKVKLGAKDVTNYVDFNNNVLIIPSQQANIGIIGPDFYVYNSYYLVIIYENPSLPTVSLDIYINNKRKFGYDSYSLLTNPILTANDVGLSILPNFACSNCDGSAIQPFDFTINSTLGSFPIGSLDAAGGIGDLAKKTLPGSFTFENNTLYGLVDDTPDGIIDSCDALANIKNYIANNTAQFMVDVYSGFTTDKFKNYISSFILVHSTPCPAHGFRDTIVKHTICQGQSIPLNTQSAGNSYKWYPANTLNDSTSATPIATPTTTTNYVVRIDSAGCKHTEHVQVAVIPLPAAAAITTSDNVCGGPSGKITIKPGHGPFEPYTYSLNNGAFLSDTVFNNLTGGNYTITIKDNAGCSWESNIITVIDTLKVNAGFTIQTATSIYTAPLYVHVSNNTSGATNYNWYFPTATASTYNSDYTFTNSGTYTITLIAYNNTPTCADTATLTITVLPEDTAGIFIPNVFSPNGDGNNDVFEIKIMNATLELVEIYDRWGVQVCNALDLTTTKNANITSYAWTGRSTSGMECSSGTYFYCIKIKPDAKYNKGESKTYTGFISVIR